MLQLFKLLDIGNKTSANFNSLEIAPIEYTFYTILLHFEVSLRYRNCWLKYTTTWYITSIESFFFFSFHVFFEFYAISNILGEGWSK